MTYAPTDCKQRHSLVGLNTPTHTTSGPHKSSRNFGRGRTSTTAGGAVFHGHRLTIPGGVIPLPPPYLTRSPPLSVNVAFVSVGAFCAHTYTHAHTHTRELSCAQLTCSITRVVNSIFACTIQKPSKTGRLCQQSLQAVASTHFSFPGLIRRTPSLSG